MRKETRRHRRLSFVGTIFIELVSSGIEENQPSEVALCKTIDIARTGLLVWVNRELTVGAILQIGVELSSGGSTLYLTGEVRRCQRDHTNAERWEVGFELLNASDSDIDTWQELLTQLSQPSA